MLARAALLIGVILLIGVLRGCVFRPANDYSASHFNKRQNAIWLGVEWANEAHTSAEITALAADLKRRQIVHVYAYASYLRANGVFNQSYAHAADFIREAKAAHPGLRIQAWIGLPLHFVDLSQDTVRQSIATFGKQMIDQIGFDGIHLDPEPISDGDSNVLRLLEDVRQALGVGPILSIATRTIWPVLPEAPIWPRLFGPVMWSSRYYQDIARRVDQIALMTYDTGLPAPVLYRLWTRFQVISLSQSLDGFKVDLLIGVPTSEEHTPTHNPVAENMQSGLQGVLDGLNDYEARPAAITGIAVYPHWETDAAEWATYESLWLGTR